MITDEQWDRYKRTIPGLGDEHEGYQAARRKELEELGASDGMIEAYLAESGFTPRSFTVGQLIAQLKRYPEDTPVFGWAETRALDSEPVDVPTPTLVLSFEKVAPLDSTWVEAEPFAELLESHDPDFRSKVVTALMIGGIATD